MRLLAREEQKNTCRVSTIPFGHALRDAGIGQVLISLHCLHVGSRFHLPQQIYLAYGDHLDQSVGRVSLLPRSGTRVKHQKMFGKGSVGLEGQGWKHASDRSEARLGFQTVFSVSPLLVIRILIRTLK